MSYKITEIFYHRWQYAGFEPGRVLNLALEGENSTTPSSSLMVEVSKIDNRKTFSCTMSNLAVSKLDTVTRCQHASSEVYRQSVDHRIKLWCCHISIIQFLTSIGYLPGFFTILMVSVSQVKISQFL